MIAYVVSDQDGNNHGPFLCLERAISLSMDIREDGIYCQIFTINFSDDYLDRE